MNPPPRSITDTGVALPEWADVLRVLTLQDYNTRVVVIGTTLLGLAAGVVGTFAYLRKRALMGDALSHATLPGIAVVFLLTGAKSLPLLLIGAAISGILGVLAVVALRSVSRLKEDAAIGIVLSVFFAVGMVLFSVIQQMKSGNEAGLTSFIYGKAASMLNQDAWLIGGAGLLAIALTAAFFKEFRVVCFDQQFAASAGTPVLLVDFLMMALVVLTTVVGLQAVGLILVVAMLIIPPAAARFWTDRLEGMTILAAACGALAGWAGASISALLPRLPTGAVIVLCAGALFCISMFLAPHRGIIAASLRRRRLRRVVAYQHLLRALAEAEENMGDGVEVTESDLMRVRSWSPAGLRRVIGRAERSEDVAVVGTTLRLTDQGRAQAVRVLRNHRLWEMYLIRYADIAPSHVDRGADEVEHVLSDVVVRELEEALHQALPVPPSPHVETTLR